MQKLFTILCLLSLISCSQPEAYPWLYSLDPGSGHMESGERLMSLNLGLNALEETNGDEEILFIGVHGSKSQGYEWIYPLQTVDNQNTAVYFYRWDDSACSFPSTEFLDTHIGSLLEQNPKFQLVVLMGHSYGGVLVSSFVDSWKHSLPVEIHSVAGPLKGIKGLNIACNYKPPIQVSKNVTFYQWRTKHHLDSAFNKQKEDPQIIDLKDSKVVRLPDTYRGRRLGHNWSISWVADEMDASTTNVSPIKE